ncbi:hypothetical protein ACLVWU_02475 [Bdellovibrio sp. HCB290]|uniref:hypothetical protein n=1 Tax=Bdellovibrio sp. HCB290 TaxID=3394356 RepID=UPI0039B44B4B
MNPTISLLAVLLSASLFTACVEVRDKDELAKGGQVVIKEIRHLVIDEPYYFVGGEFIPARRLHEKPQAERSLLGTRNVYDVVVDTLTITDKGILFTMGHDIQITARILESQNGTITTFPDTHEPSIVTEGVSGGNLILKVVIAEGRLNLFMQGERGGPGMPGGAPNPNMDGRAIPLSGNVMGCTTPKNGAPGGPGARGGISGTAEVDIQEEDGFVLNAKALPGMGGRGGPGGEGGRYCMGDRKRGPSGAMGPQGAEGTIQTLCIRIGERGRQCM